MSSEALVESLGFYVNRVEGAVSVFTKSLDDIFQPGFHSVLLTNYMFHLSWLFQRVPVLWTAKKLLIVHGDEQVSYSFSHYSYITFHKPALPFIYGTHHTKLIILFYPTTVRFVLTTANMIESDWEYKTQGLFLKDFPQTDEMKSCLFLETLQDYLSALGEPLDYYCSLLCKYDFTKAGVVLIPSIPGYHKGRNLHKYGHMSLYHNLCKYSSVSSEQRRRRKDNGSSSSIRLLLQCSSIGRISEKWLTEEFFHSLVSSCWKQEEDWRCCFEWDLMWPSVSQVRNSVQGYVSGAAFPWSKKNYRSFPKTCHLCLWNGYFFGRNAWLPHMKSYMAYEESGNILWFLLTSANLSTAAWGSLVRSPSQLFIRSYELGVLWTPMLCSSSPPLDGIIQLTTPQYITPYDSPPHKSVLFCLPLPFQLPPQRYESNDSPWLWDDVYTSPDNFGNVWPLE